MMKVMLAAIEIFSLVYQRIFAQKVLTQRKHSRVWECFVWGMYFVISNFFTYSFAKSAWDNTGIFVVSFFFALRILYIDSAWVLSAVTAFMAISGALSEVLTYYGWQIFVQKSGVKVDTANEDYLLLLVSKLVMFFFIKILLALIKRHKNIRLNTQEWVEIFMIPGGSIVILAERELSSIFIDALPKRGLTKYGPGNGAILHNGYSLEQTTHGAVFNPKCSASCLDILLSSTSARTFGVAPMYFIL